MKEQMHQPVSAAVNPLTGALQGVRVIDFSQIAAGPMCSMLLADMGANVIKVDPPEGDIGRKLGPPFVQGESPIFLSVNRNKRSIIADLKTDAARERIHRLIKTADVLIESFRPGVADRLGIGFAEARAINPKIIYCSISAYGQQGPWSDKPGVDGVIQAVSGLMSVTGMEGEPPSKLQAPVVDMVTGLQAMIAVLLALRKRDHGIDPVRLDINLLSGALILQQIPFTSYLVSDELPLRTGSGAPYATPNEAYRTADGYVLIAAYQPGHWRKFCRVIGGEYLSEDPRFAQLAERMQHRAELRGLIEQVLQDKPTSHWAELFEQHGITSAPIADYRDVVSYAQVEAAGLLTSVHHTKLGEIRMPGFSIGGPSLSVHLPPPMLGEHDELEDWPTCP